MFVFFAGGGGGEQLTEVILKDFDSFSGVMTWAWSQLAKRVQEMADFGMHHITSTSHPHDMT